MSDTDDEDYKKAIRERAMELLQTKPKKEKVERVKIKRVMSEEQKLKVLDRLEKARVKAREVIAQKSQIMKEMKNEKHPQQPVKSEPVKEEPKRTVKSEPVKQSQPPQPQQSQIPPQPQQSQIPPQPIQPPIKATYFKPSFAHYKKHHMNPSPL